MRALRLPSFTSGWVQRPAWLRAFLFALAGCAVVYLLNLALAPVGAGTLLGRTYGALATVLMVAAAALAARRRAVRRLPGRAQTWVQLHVYGGALALVLTLMHAGFRWPRERLTWWLLLLSLWVTVSGLIGVALRKWIPRLLTSALRTEVIYERIPDLVADVRQRCEALAAAGSPPLQEFYRQSVAPRLERPRVRWIYFVDITGGIQARIKDFEFVRVLLAAPERERLAELESLFATKLELDAHYTLQKPLRWWLYAHVPVSYVLLLLIAIHLFAVLFY